MSKVLVLVTTMHQKDISKYYEMNLQTDAVIANQADCEDKAIQNVNGNSVCMVTTSTRGLSKNRNIAISNMLDNAEYIVFADDDLIFMDGYADIIENEFDVHPEAEAIRFNLECISERKISMRPIKAFHRAKFFEVTSYGVCGLVIRKNTLIKTGIKFNERFGTGTPNYCGEDSIFYGHLFKNKVKLFLSEKVISKINQSGSSWFEGYNEKYFVISGKVNEEKYGVLALPMCVVSAIRFSRRAACKLKFIPIMTCFLKGMSENRKEKRNEKK